MKTLKMRVRRHRTALIMGLFRACVYGGLLLLFFGLMAIHNSPLLRPSRTLATTLLTFMSMAVVMHLVYGGYAVGQKKSKPVISSMALAALVTDAVTYLQLQIMNVNEHNNAHLRLFGPDFPWLLIGMAAQVLWIILWVRVGNTVYFRLNPPRKCLLILGDPGEKEALMHKIGRYRLQWRVTDTAMWNDPKLVKRIRRCDVVFLGEIPSETKMALLKTCYDLQRDVNCKAQLQDIMLSNAKQTIVDDAPFLTMEYRKMTLGQRLAKRTMDVVISGLVLTAFSPLMLALALLIRLEDGGPALFKQKRMTVNGRIFTIYKFRTMRQDASAQRHQVSAQEGDSRITRIGAALRRSRLDELPQMWNILIGDMTLVGPRPEMLENVDKYKRELPAFVYREKMKAGLTGYAQIEGRYNTSPEDKLMLDLMYIESFSVWLDVKLLLRTLTVFFKSDSTEGFTPVERPTKDQAPNLDV